jgi:hypothetical protein
MQPSPEDWIPPQAAGRETGLDSRRDRRVGPERRHRVWWAFFYGSVRPRRRLPARRLGDAQFYAMDWHGAHLWAVSIVILILSAADAFLTLTLMSGGAVEVNPLMAMFLGGNVTVFAGFKMAMTGIGVTMMVFLARYRFLRVVRVEVILYAVLTAYIVLIVHELRMLQVLADRQLL